MYRYPGESTKLNPAHGERILWHVLEHLQYDMPLDYAAADGPNSTGRWMAIQTIKQLLGVTVA
jgi:hypothetical protein